MIDFPFKAGQHLIEASAGTGKTYTLMQIILRLLIGQASRDGRAYDIREILVVTFTQAATQELNHRLSELLRDAALAFEQSESRDPMIQSCIDASANLRLDLNRIRRASLTLNEASVYTIHGFCSQVLASHNIAIGVPPNLAIETDQSADLVRIAEDLFRLHVLSLPPLEQEIALTIWKSPEAMRQSLAALLSRSKLTVFPTPPVTELPERLSALMQEIKATWIDQDLCSLIETSDLMQSRKAYKQRHLMTQLAEGAALLPSDERWDIWRRSALTAVTKKGGQPPEHPIFALFDDVHELRQQIPFYKAGHVARVWNAFRSERKKLTFREGRMGVDDLIPSVVESLRDDRQLARDLAKQHPVMLIDEFQDTDDQQYTLFKTIASQPDSRNLVLIGDPKQAIYRFRGADINTYLRAAHQSQEQHRLDTNWRSSVSIVEAVNHLFGANKSFSQDESISFFPSLPSKKAPSNPVLQRERPIAPCRFVIDSSQASDQRTSNECLAATAAKAIAGLFEGPDRIELANADSPSDSKPLGAHQLAILVRNRSEAQLMQDGLAELGLRSVYRSRQSVMDTPVAQDLVLILSAILRPRHFRTMMSAIATRLFQFDYAELLDIRHSEKKQQRYYEQFSQWRETWEKIGVDAAIHQLIADQKLASVWLALDGGARVLTDLRHLAECLGRRQHTLASKQQLINWLAGDYASDESLHSDETIQRLESDEDLIQIMTIHAAKGLEFEAVCLPFANFSSKPTKRSRGSIIETPDSSASSAEIVLESSSDLIAALDRQAEEEEMRLLYVALTRAKSLMILGLPSYATEAKTAAKSEHRPPIFKLLGLSEQDNLIEAVGHLPSHLFAIHPERKGPYHHQITSYPSPITKRVIPRISDNGPRVLSYTGLSRHLTTHLPAHASGLTDEPSKKVISIDSPASDDMAHFLADGLPRGTTFGIHIHALLEHLDFTRPINDQLRVVEQFEQIFQISATREKALLRDWLHNIMRAPLLDNGFCLEHITQETRLDELEFHFPVSQVDALNTLPFLDRTRLEGMRSPKLTAFMTGSIDLVFKHDERYYIVDYKSNHLGMGVEPYATSRLERAMKDHDYDLQYAIYAIALEKYLALRHPGESFRERFGGVLYLFLRGMSHQSNTGVFFCRPDPAAIVDVSKKISYAQ